MSAPVLGFVLAATLALGPAPEPAAAPELAPAAVAADFEALWREVAESYAYFDRKLTDWSRVPALYRSELARVRTRDELIAVLERVLEELYDPHLHLNANNADSPRLVPSGADLWAAWRDGRAIVEQVRAGSDAERAGLRAGVEIVALDGVPIAAVIDARLPRSLRRIDDEVRSWALRAALAGRHGAPRQLQWRIGAAARSSVLPGADQVHAHEARLSWKSLPEGIGYVLLHDSLGEDRLIAEFDAALAGLADSAGLVLDLRDTPSGGNTTVARAILGRFVATERPYQKHALPAEERQTGVRRSWLELVSPRGPFRYHQPVAVLVGRWTGSMGEGLAMGFAAAADATVVGTPMAQLLGATYHLELPHSRIGVNIPAEQLFHPDGTPREAFVPEVLLTREDLTEPNGDPWLTRALQILSGLGPQRGSRSTECRSHERVHHQPDATSRSCVEGKGPGAGRGEFAGSNSGALAIRPPAG